MRWSEIGVFVLFLGGATVFTYPLALDIRTATKDHHDPLLDAWALSWVAHQLPRDPVHLFDSNRFYPETGTLAFNDPMVGLGILMAPVAWLFGDALLTFNLATLFAFALSGYGAYRLGWHLTGSRVAGAVAGSVFAFDAYRLSHLAHVQLQNAGFIPLLYLCLRRYLEEGKLRYAVGVAVFLWFVCASSAYYGIFTWILLGVAIPYELFRTRTATDRRRVIGLGLALLLAGLAFLPLALPFMRLGDDFGLSRPTRRLQRASARPGDYLRSGSHLHQALGLKPSSSERTLFPGILAVGLALLAIARLNRASGLYLILAIVAAWASLGPAWGLYRVLHAVIPGLDGIRVPPRFAIYVFFAMAMLAAHGAALVLKRFPSHALGAALVLFPLVESVGPTHYTQAPPIPAVYAWLSEIPGSVPVVELPLPPPKRDRDNAIYLYWSTTHFKPLANGYGTVVPPVYAEIFEACNPVPDDAAIVLLERLGFRYVILHRDLYLRDRAAEMEKLLNALSGLKRVHRTENETVYEVS